MLQELFKGKGDPGLTKAYREVLLSDDDGKAVSAHIRGHIMPKVQAIVMQTQYGSGFGGGECAFAHLSVQLFIDMCRHKMLSASVLFVDITQAFARLMRKIAFLDPTCDEHWLAALKQAGYPQEDIDMIYQAIGQVAWIDNNDGCINKVQSHGLAMTSAWYKTSWFSTEGLLNVVRTSRGSGAGSPLADVVF